MEERIQEIIVKVLEGNASIEEKKELQDWSKESLSNNKQLEQVEGIWNALEIINQGNKFDAQVAYNSFLNKTETRIIKHPGRIWLRIAGIIVIVISFSFLLWHFTQSTIEKISYFEIQTPNGSHTQITLTDGTVVWLNAGSKLRYPNRFEDNTRTVYLEGEAFFKVKTNKEKPFIVKTSEVNVKALGTSFNVKAYPKEGSIETTLVEGVVVVERNKKDRKAADEIKLLPSQRATFIKTTGRLLLNDQEHSEYAKSSTIEETGNRDKESMIVTQEVNTELYTSWVDNKLFFENETFESIAYKLERRYGAIILFKDDKIKKYRFSGKFPEISIDRALKALQFASPFHYEMKQDTIFIK